VIVCGIMKNAVELYQEIQEGVGVAVGMVYGNGQDNCLVFNARGNMNADRYDRVVSNNAKSLSECQEP